MTQVAAGSTTSPADENQSNADSCNGSDCDELKNACQTDPAAIVSPAASSRPVVRALPTLDGADIAVVDCTTDVATLAACSSG